MVYGDSGVWNWAIHEHPILVTKPEMFCKLYWRISWLLIISFLARKSTKYNFFFNVKVVNRKHFKTCRCEKLTRPFSKQCSPKYHPGIQTVQINYRPGQNIWVLRPCLWSDRESCLFLNRWSNDNENFPFLTSDFGNPRFLIPVDSSNFKFKSGIWNIL